MPLSEHEQDRIGEQFADDPRRGQVLQAAAERAALVEHDQDTSGPDKRLAGFGYETDDQRAAAKAAAERKRAAAAKDDDGKDDKPAKQSTPPAQTGTRGRATRAGHASGGKGDD